MKKFRVGVRVASYEYGCIDVEAEDVFEVYRIIDDIDINDDRITWTQSDEGDIVEVNTATEID